MHPTPPSIHIIPGAGMPCALLHTPPWKVSLGIFIIFCFYKQCCSEELVHMVLVILPVYFGDRSLEVELLS